MKRTIFSLLVVMAFVAGAPEEKGYEVGDLVTDFKLKNVDGKMVSLADWKDAKGFIVAFDCNTCPVSQKYNDRIKALSKKYAGQGFPLIAINPNSPDVSSGESFDEMVRVSKKKNYNFPYLFDESQEVIRQYQPTNTPHVFVLVKSGSSLKVAYIGAIDDNARDEAGVKKRYVEEAVDALLAGKSVSTTKTKAIGCGIKWKNS